MTSKTIVLGASGFLGSHFVQHEYPEIYQYRTQPESSVPRHLILDPWNTDELEKVIMDQGLESLINCIALANIENCESNEAKAFEINSELPRRLAELCKRRSVHLVHVSTDAVLLDAKGLLDENSPTNPKSVYGKFFPTEMHKISAQENAGDLGAFRKLLFDKGVTKQYGEDINMNSLKKALKNPSIKKEPHVKRLLESFDEKSLIELNNAVAALSTSKKENQA